MSDNFFKQILTVGPPLYGKGGIVTILQLYKENINNFRFINSFTTFNKVTQLIFFPFNLLNFIFLLALDENIRIIHIHGASRGSFIRKYFYFIISKYVFGKKVIYHINGAEYHIFYKNAPFLTKKLIKHFIEKADLIITLSEGWKNFYLKTFNAKKLCILPNIAPAISERENRLTGKIVFLFLGRIGQRKGTYDLIETIRDNREMLKNDFELIIGGDGETEELQKLITQYNIADLVKYYGWVTGDAKKELLRKSNVYILPSYNEGLPLSILEAMSYSMPVISTPVGGTADVVKEGKNGKLVTPGNKTQLADAILYFLKNKEKIKEYGEESYRIVAENCFPHVIVKKLNVIYSDLLK